MNETFTVAEKLSIIGQVFLKIGLNFWPVILLGLAIAVYITREESRAK